MKGGKLLSVSGLEIRLPGEKGPLAAVRGLSFSVNQGESVCLVGESGCGKSVTALSLLGLLPRPPFTVSAGEILFSGRNILALSEEDLCRIRGKDMAMIFQEPMTALNPVFTVGQQIEEAITVHFGAVDRHRLRGMVEDLLAKVGMEEPGVRMGQYPHELSGGLRQRVMIAMALSCGPRLLVADEPTTALDVSIQAQILDLLDELRIREGLGLLLITHNLGVVARIADRVLIMYAGRIVEEAAADDLFREPLHPYSRGLLASTPPVHDRGGRRLIPIPGTVPSLRDIPPGCAFQTRCRHVMDICKDTIPPDYSPAGGHRVSCHLYG